MNKIISAFISLIKLKRLIYIFNKKFLFSDVELLSDVKKADLRKKAKKPKRSNKLRQLNYIGAKKHIVTKKRRFFRNRVKRKQSLMKECKSECPTSVKNQIPLEMKTNVAEFSHPILRTAIDWFESEYVNFFFYSLFLFQLLLNLIFKKN